MTARADSALAQRADVCARAAEENVMKRGIHAANSTFVAALSAFLSACSGAGDPADGTGTGRTGARGAPGSAADLVGILAPAAASNARLRAMPRGRELKKRCDDYATGTIYPPNGNAYPNYPNVGQGYQGEEYLPVIRALGLCYRTERAMRPRRRATAPRARACSRR